MTIAIEIVNVIAALCLAHGNEPSNIIDHRQLGCQQYYLECIDRDHGPSSDVSKLVDCIKLRKIE